MHEVSALLDACNQELFDKGLGSETIASLAIINTKTNDVFHVKTNIQGRAIAISTEKGLNIAQMQVA